MKTCVTAFLLKMITMNANLCHCIIQQVPHTTPTCCAQDVHHCLCQESRYKGGNFFKVMLFKTFNFVWTIRMFIMVKFSSPTTPAHQHHYQQPVCQHHSRPAHLCEEEVKKEPEKEVLLRWGASPSPAETNLSYQRFLQGVHHQVLVSHRLFILTIFTIEVICPL